MQKAGNVEDSVATVQMGDVVVPKAIICLILNQLAQEIRHIKPKKWDSLKLVCRTFQQAILQIDNNDKLVFFNEVEYPEELPLVRDPQIDHLFNFKSKKKLIAVLQLGRQVYHYFAPLLTCSDKFEVRLYEITRDLQVAKKVSAYNEHKAKLTVALSLSSHVVTVDENGFIGVWLPRKRSATSLRFYKGHDQEVSAIDYLNNSKFVTAAGNEVKFWDTKSSDPDKTIKVKGTVVALLAKSFNEYFLLTRKPTNKITLSFYSQDVATKVYHCSYDDMIYPFGIANEIRISSPNKVIGLLNTCQTVNIGALTVSDEATKAETKKIRLYQQRLDTQYTFLSRGQFCAFLLKGEKTNYSVLISVEPAKLGVIVEPSVVTAPRMS